MEKKQKLFVRPASGLVREVSTSRAACFSAGAAVAWQPAWMPAWVTWVPAFMLLGMTSLTWSVSIAGLFMLFVLTPIYAVLATALPRSGGDQIFTTRITHPLAGFVESWTFIFSILAFMGYGINILVLTTSASVRILGMASPEPWNSLAQWLMTWTGTVVSGLVIMGIIVLISIQPTRRFHTINTWLVLLGLVLAYMMIPLFPGIDKAVFMQNFQHFFGKTVQDITNEASTAGFSIGTFDITVLGILFGFGLIQYVGFQYTAFLAGELKGNVFRSLFIASAVSVIWVVFNHTVYLQYFVTTFGVDLVMSMSYLFYTTGTAPFVPLAQGLLAVAKPEWAAFLCVSAMGSFLIGMSLCVTWLVTAVRAAFAMSMDRLLPTRLSEIDPKTKSPMKLMYAFLGIWLFMFLSSNYGLNLIYGAVTSSLLALLVWTLPGVNAVLLPYRRPDLYDLIPKSLRKTLGLPVVTILGIIWLCFSVPIYFLYVVWPIFAQAYGEHVAGALNIAVQSGLLSYLVIIIAGIVIYYTSKSYNKRRGIDMDMLFKTVPPE